MPLSRRALPPGSFTITNDETDTVIDQDNMTINELANVLATLIRLLKGA